MTFHNACFHYKCPHPVRWRGDSIREILLHCVSPERRQAIEAQVAYRIAAEESERQRRAAEAARRTHERTMPVFLPPTQARSVLPLRPNAMADYLDPETPLLTNYLSEFLRRG
jgi:hypothetical protein